MLSALRLPTLILPEKPDSTAIGTSDQAKFVIFRITASENGVSQRLNSFMRDPRKYSITSTAVR